MFIAGILQFLIIIFKITSISSSEVLPALMNIKLCETACEAHGGCTYVFFTAKLLQCELIYELKTTRRRIARQRKKGGKVLKIHRGRLGIDCVLGEVVIHTRLHTPKCVSVSNKIRSTDKEKEVDDCGLNNDPCILCKKENITFTEESTNVPLSKTFKPGMKLTVYGEYMKGHEYSQITVNTNKDNPSDIFSWLHLIVYWNERFVRLTEGFQRTKYNGTFPIKDPSHFTLALEVTASSSKFYANKVLVKTLSKPIYGLREMQVHKFSKIYLLVIQKTEEECSGVDNDIPYADFI